MKKRKIKLFGRIISAKLLVLLVFGLLVSGALITVLWQTHVFSIQGDIDLEGLDQPTTGLLYDSSQILNTATTTITTMDFAVLTNGDDETATHTWESTGGYDYLIEYNYDNMPLEYIDTEDEWYGFEFYVEDSLGTENLDWYILDGAGSSTVYHHYILDALFEDYDTSDFPFYLEADITRGTMYDLADHCYPIYDEMPTITDTIGSGDMTATAGVTAETGKIGYCCCFNNIGEKSVASATTTADLDETNDFSINFWIKPTSETTSSNMFPLSKLNSNVGWSIEFFTSDFQPIVTLSDGTGKIEVKTDSGHALSIDTWTMLTVTWDYDGDLDASNMKIYWDGTDITSSCSVLTDTLTGTISNSGYFTLGSAESNYMSACLDAIIINTDYAYDTSNVAYLWNDNLGRETDLNVFIPS